MATLLTIFQALMRDNQVSKMILANVAQKVKDQYDTLGKLAESAKSGDETLYNQVINALNIRGEGEDPTHVNTLQADIDNYREIYVKAMNLVLSAKRSGDLTHYTELLDEGDNAMEEQIVAYNKSVETFNGKKKKFPYSIMGLVIKVADAEILE